MPLIKSKSRKAFVSNLKAELDAGKPHDQALAIAYAVKRRSKSRKRYASGGSPTNPALWDVPEEELPAGSGLSPITSLAWHIAKSALWDLPHKAINAAKGTSYGLRREDFTDVPPDYSPDPNSPLGGVGIAVPKGAWQPTDDLIGASLEGATNVMGGTALSAPAKGLGEAVVGAGPVRRGAQEALDMSPVARVARAHEQGYTGDWYHGTPRADRLTESGKINPKRATSGPMPYFTDDPEMASSYAMGKKRDTSLNDEGNVEDYFTVSPRDLGMSGRSPMTVEQSWHFLPPETRADITAKMRRVGYQNMDQHEGPFVLHPEGTSGLPSSDSHFDDILRRDARGNPLTALRHLWHDSGYLVDDPGKLSEIYRLAGYPHPVSEMRAPWTEAAGVLPAKLRMTNPLQTDNIELMTKEVLPALEKAFKRDRTRKQSYGADIWDKNSHSTPREWVEEAKADYAKGNNSFVWTSIPDKVTAELKRLGYDGILDNGGKMGGHGHRVAIPFGPDQVRSRFAAFDPKNAGSGKILGAGAADKRAAALSAVDDLLNQEAKLAGVASAPSPTKWTGTGYHGTASDFDEFVPKAPYNKLTGKSDVEGVYFSGDPMQASQYARMAARREGAGKQKVIAADLEMQNPLDITKLIKNGQRRGLSFGDAKREAMKKLTPEHDGVIFHGNSANPPEYIAFNNKQIARKPLTLGSGATDKRAAGIAAVDDILDAERRLAGATDEQAAHLSAADRTTVPGEAAPAGGPGTVGPGGGGPSGVRGLPEAQAAAARWAGDRPTLEGQQGPLKIGGDYFVPGPIGKIHDVAEDYMRTGHPDRPYTPPTKYHPIDPEHSKAIAQAYEDMPHTPNDPATKASYDALIDETAKQYQAIKKTGLKIEPIPAGAPDPYATNPRLAAIDVAENNHLWFFPTEGGFGSAASRPAALSVARKMPDGSIKIGRPGQVHSDLMTRAELNVEKDAPDVAGGMGYADSSGRFLSRSEALDYAKKHEPERAAFSAQQPEHGLEASTYNEATPVRSDNPMLRKTGEKIGDHELLANDMFRIVHDYFGHLKEGHGFRAAGEDNAWRTHAQMYSDLARPAMTTETRGQNSWVNYGPHGEKNRTASGADTTYADQKVGLMPEWTMRDRGSPEPIIAYHGSPYSFDRFKLEKIGAGEGNQAYGHGLYFAAHSPVSEWYRHQLASRRDPLLQKYGLDSQDGANIGMAMAQANGNPATVVADLRKYADELRAEGRSDKATTNMIARAENKIAYLSDPERAKGHMYEVAINTHPEKFLDWDAPLSQQQQILDTITPESMGLKFKQLDNGHMAYVNELDRPIGQFQKGGTEESFRKNWMERLRSLKDGATLQKYLGLTPSEATNALKKAGVAGIKYLDQASRSMGQGTRNYVAFDDNMISILRKYGIIGIPAAGVIGADGEERRAAGGAVNAAMEVARRVKRAKGGKVHIGPIIGDTGGRADKVPMSVPDGAYVIPADIVSGLGEGNTGAGMVQLGKMFPKSKPRIMRETPGAVPILAADGEFVVSPDSILDRWDDLAYGHQALDAWVLHERQQLIETLEGLEPPAQD